MSFQAGIIDAPAEVLGVTLGMYGVWHVWCFGGA
jgi:hypothetical protein